MTTLNIGGMDCRSLVDLCGTPLLVYDEEKIEEQFAAAINNFSSAQFATEVVYAAKAFSCKAMFEKAQQAGAGVDVVSGGELFCAQQAGVNLKNVYFHGNNKSEQELDMALELGCGTIVLDNLMECKMLAKRVGLQGKSIDVLLRVNPGIEAHTHKYILTANLDSKFGVSIDSKETIKEIIKICRQSGHMIFKGFHSHIGSQITEFTAFDKQLEIMLDLCKEFQVQTLSIGGGFGIKYIAGDKPIPLGEIAKRLARRCERLLEAKHISLEKLVMEPGRAIVGEAGHSLYKVGYSKQTINKHYIFVDGGMSDNIRPALYQAQYSCDLANKIDQPKTIETCVAGKNCESGDILVENAKLPPAEEGDLLVMYATGAYGYSMASNYNRAGRPAVVFVKNGAARLVLRRETYEDQLRLDTNKPLVLLREEIQDECSKKI